MRTFKRFRRCVFDYINTNILEFLQHDRNSSAKIIKSRKTLASYAKKH